MYLQKCTAGNRNVFASEHVKNMSYGVSIELKWHSGMNCAEIRDLSFKTHFYHIFLKEGREREEEESALSTPVSGGSKSTEREREPGKA